MPQTLRFIIFVASCLVAGWGFLVCIVNAVYFIAGPDIPLMDMDRLVYLLSSLAGAAICYAASKFADYIFLKE